MKADILLRCDESDFTAEEIAALAALDLEGDASIDFNNIALSGITAATTPLSPTKKATSRKPSSKRSSSTTKVSCGREAAGAPPQKTKRKQKKAKSSGSGMEQPVGVVNSDLSGSSSEEEDGEVTRNALESLQSGSAVIIPTSGRFSTLSSRSAVGSRYHKEAANFTSATKETNSLRGNSNVRRGNSTFTFSDLVAAVLCPEDRIGGADAIADALLQVRMVELQDCGLRDSTLLECLGPLSHAYLQHNNLTDLAGLQLATSLTVLVVNHNRLRSLEDISGLINLALLDASYNVIDGLDVELHLPTSSLKSLNLIGNPCAPNYGSTATEDVEYCAMYREQLIVACSRLISLDGKPLSKHDREECGAEALDEPLLTHLTNEDAEQAHEAEENEVKRGMRTAFNDNDFFEAPIGHCGDSPADEYDGSGGGGDLFDGTTGGYRNSPPPGKGCSSDDDDDKPPAKPPRPPATATSRKQLSPSNKVAMPSIAERLIAQYTKQQAIREDLVDKVVRNSNQVNLSKTLPGVANPSSSSSSSDEDDNETANGSRVSYSDPHGGLFRTQHASWHVSAGTGGRRTLTSIATAKEQQTQLRAELRLAQMHHSQIAQQVVMNTWDEAERKLRDRHLHAQERRAEMAARLSRPSAAYLAAIQLLKQESGCDDLNKYRVEQKS